MGGFHSVGGRKARWHLLNLQLALRSLYCAIKQSCAERGGFLKKDKKWGEGAIPQRVAPWLWEEGGVFREKLEASGYRQCGEEKPSVQPAK